MHNNRLKDRETHRKDRSNIYALGYLCLTFAEFRTEPANCSAQNPLIVRVDIRGRLRGYMQIIHAVICGKSLSFPCHVPYMHRINILRHMN